ncbi:organic solute transporter subunit alpha-like [Liolophura sinensis]|uniref:organic solute transporter subunit alpha-like n=1 Tax=Liolophura sinensis TaxID=3198878 RepID=UPI0031586BAA
MLSKMWRQRFNINELRNCSSDFPFTRELFEDLSKLGIAVIGCMCFVTLVICLIFLEELCFLIRHDPDWRNVRRKLWLLGLYPVFGFCCIVAVIVPRSSQLNDLISAVYLSICLVQFMRLMILYFGGEVKMLVTLSSVDIPLQSPPIACCLCCLPRKSMTRSRLNWIKGLVWQVALLRPVFTFTSAVLWSNGQYNPHLLTIDSPYTYIVSINGISTLLAMYGLIMVFRMAKLHLTRVNITHKFACLQLMLVFSNLQPVIISFIGSSGLIKCQGSISTEAKTEMLSHLLLLAEVFLLSIYARWHYRRKHEWTDSDTDESLR